MTLAATNRIEEHGDFVYISTPVSLYVPGAEEIEQFAFAQDLKSLAPNPQILWMRGQYVEADQANRNADQWTAGELAIKALTPKLMPITVMHDLRSAVGTIADARLFTPEKDSVPRARIDTTLALWAHRFPEVAEECRVNSQQGTLMQSMECHSPYYDCSICGSRLERRRGWEEEWRHHATAHADAIASDGRSPARILVNVTFTGVGLIFGTRGARGAMPAAHLEVEELAAMHREAHESTCSARQQRPTRRKNTVDIEDSKYEALVSAKSEAESKVTDLQAQVADRDKKIETLEAEKVAAEEKATEEKKRADDAEEATRVAAMRDERLGAFGTQFRAKLDKLETTKANVTKQAATLSDEEWEARVKELEESWDIKRDAALDAKESDGGKGPEGDEPKGLFSREQVRGSAAADAGEESTEVTASAQTPTSAGRQTVMRGLIRTPQKREKAKA